MKEKMSAHNHFETSVDGREARQQITKILSKSSGYINELIKQTSDKDHIQNIRAENELQQQQKRKDREKHDVWDKAEVSMELLSDRKLMKRQRKEEKKRKKQKKLSKKIKKKEKSRRKDKR